MNPLDPECPSMAPNYFDVCPFVDRFIEFTEKHGIIVEYPEEEEGSSIFDFFGMSLTLYLLYMVHRTTMF